MLKLTRHLFCRTADSRTADYYERALYNHILGQQDPQSSMFCYFLPMMSGAYKLYATRDSSYWCCVGSGFESNAKYAEAVYYHNADRIEARFPMSLRLEPTPDDPTRAAVCFGPVVLAGRMGTEGMAPPAPYSNPKLYNDYYTYDFRVPASLSDTLRIDIAHPEKSLKRVPGTLDFLTADGRTLSPLYDIHHERYAVYWHVTPNKTTSK